MGQIIIGRMEADEIFLLECGRGGFETGVKIADRGDVFFGVGVKRLIWTAGSILTSASRINSAAADLHHWVEPDVRIAQIGFVFFGRPRRTLRRRSWLKSSGVSAVLSTSSALSPALTFTMVARRA